MQIIKKRRLRKGKSEADISLLAYISPNPYT